MFLIIAAILLAVWLLYSGWKFYNTIDWSEPAEPSPDLQGMHKRQAELEHIVSVLTEARDQGKLSASAVEEVTHYADTEIASLVNVEKEWKNRRKRSPA